MPGAEPRARAADTGKAEPPKFTAELPVASPEGGNLLQSELRMPDRKQPVPERFLEYYYKKIFYESAPKSALLKAPLVIVKIGFLLQPSKVPWAGTQVQSQNQFQTVPPSCLPYYAQTPPFF